MVNRIRTVREALQPSQREFEEQLGVSRDVISNIEYARVKPKELLLQLICRQYNVNRGIGWIREMAKCSLKLRKKLLN